MKHNRLVVGLLTMLALGVLTACSSPVEKVEEVEPQELATVLTWQEQYDLGMKYLSEGNYQEAIIAFTAAIELESKKAEAYLGLADVYVAMGEIEKALEIAEQGYARTNNPSLEEYIKDLAGRSVVTWHDATMETLIRMAIQQPEGDVTQDSLNQVTELYIYGDSIAFAEESLGESTRRDGETFDFYYWDSGQEAVLNQAYGTLTDLSDLTYLRNLTHLTIQFNQITDITHLEQLTSLTHLNLSDNNLITLDGVQSLGNLMLLDVSTNQIASIAPLEQLPQLTQLYLYSNKIQDMTPLQPLENLTLLWMDENEITDITTLEGMTQLIELYLSKNNIADITPLANLTNLKYLQLGYNENLRDITSLQFLPNLELVSLRDIPVTDWSPVAHVETVFGRPE